MVDRRRDVGALNDASGGERRCASSTGIGARARFRGGPGPHGPVHRIRYERRIRGHRGAEREVRTGARTADEIGCSPARVLHHVVVAGGGQRLTRGHDEVGATGLGPLLTDPGDAGREQDPDERDAQALHPRAHHHPRSPSSSRPDHPARPYGQTPRAYRDAVAPHLTSGPDRLLLPTEDRSLVAHYREGHPLSDLIPAQKSVTPSMLIVAPVT